MKTKEIYFDKAGFASFEKSCIDTAERCNDLIQIFENFQEWQKIKTLNDWLDLVTDPKAYFDKVLLLNVDLKVTGSRQPDPEVLAKLLAVERDSYLNLVAGLPVADPTCSSCKKMKVRKGATAINIYQYQQFENYLLFNNAGNFTISEEKISIKKDSFKIFADSPEKLEITNFWQSLSDTLNLYHDRYHITADNKMLIAKILKLQLSEGTDGRFIVNTQAVGLEIINLKSKIHASKN